MTIQHAVADGGGDTILQCAAVHIVCIVVQLLLLGSVCPTRTSGLQNLAMLLCVLQCTRLLVQHTDTVLQ
jgi:hypothetical protein